MLSRTSSYALRAVLCLARHPGERVSATEIAERLDVPQNYLSKILHALARAGILDSERGPTGGFELARSADELSLVDVVQLFDEIGQPDACLLGRPSCSERSPCAVHDRWQDASRRIVDFFQETRVADLLERATASHPKGG